jgi:hypothetical protein
MGGYALSGKCLPSGPTCRTLRPAPTTSAPATPTVATCVTGEHLMPAATLAPRCCRAEPERDAFQRHNERDPP